ncbi:NnrU family protein [Neorhizobium galegae bv. officinalis bv. officinalis str. HAMBI 1141]|uniref:NnrU family protein n=1 Tax=Neorhizobium galegae bv. officinalis bv. officinalis str. HAMBI 1141 TaxID=1028801 RepID=A0A068TBB5_NEOGA|nr:NnrU family protein [Neorhizobium galegae]CDN55812.1 NnrU family protein [Neorhizobium galegae bv. officinalis bv. officinalis str. HAMBI 1141]
MLRFLLAFIAFIALHSLPAVPKIRGALIGWMGHGSYIAAYSTISTAALAWLFLSAMSLDYVEIWQPRPWQAWPAFVLSPIGLFLVLAGLFSRNPFSISFRKGGEPDAIVAVTRHPVLWGFLCWSVGHIPPNGDLRSLLLFGGFAAFSAGGLFMLEKRARRSLGPTWPTASSQTSVIPFAAAINSKAVITFDMPMAAAMLCTTALLVWLLGGGHAALVGADPLLFLGA